MSAINRKEIAGKIKARQPITISFAFAEKDLVMAINGVYTNVFTASDQLYILNSIVTIMREVVTNSLKANAKRAYFTQQKLDIMNSSDYQTGMKDFKENVIGDINAFRAILEKSGLRVVIDISWSADLTVIRVENTAAILPAELERITLRMAKSRAYVNFMEAYEDLEDSTEGAGLGIALTIVTLKNIGIDPSLFTIGVEEGNTVVTLRIPVILKPEEITSRIKDEILSRIEGIPPFPQTVLRLLGLCDSPDSSMEEIGRLILTDPGLTADLLRLSNSAGFITGKRISDIPEAVTILGLRNIRSMLMASGARKIMDDRFSRFEEIWDHCAEVAFYARHLARTLHDVKVAEKAYLAGLLHDLGKIVLLATDAKTAEDIARQVRDRSIITETFMEEISIGISHETMGKLIAGHWQFPDYLREAIGHHHSPMGTSVEFRDAAAMVYLANMFSGIDTGKYNYYYFDEGILERYAILNRSAFDALHAAIKEAYASQKSLREG